MKRICLLVTLSCAFFSAIKAQDSIQATIILAGDAGQLTNGRHPVLNAIRNHFPLDKKTTIVFLGDNLYRKGMPDNESPGYEQAKAALDSQLHVADGRNAGVYLIPGNHDWDNAGRNGYEAILRAQEYIDSLGNKNVTMIPRDGCGGPVEVKLSSDATMVVMDSQWWIHEYDKPGIESDCPYKTKAEVLLQLKDILHKNRNRFVLIAMHHPLRSYGEHGGYYTLKQHIFPFTDYSPGLYIPLPVIGSVYPLTRGVFGTSQDLKHPFYQRMIKDIEDVVKGYPNVVFAGGHEHTLQLIKDNGYYYIVSGSGSKSTRVSKSRNTLFASSENGFVALTISKNKNVSATYYSVEGDSMKEAYTAPILDFSMPQVQQAGPTVNEKIVFADSVLMPGSKKYRYSSWLRNFLLGKNYRKEWSRTDVSFKVFNLKTEKGGFKIVSLGGGKQTKSLRLKDSDGYEWVLRTMDKDPEKAVPENLRGTIAQQIVEDMISASHPYAPLVVPGLSKAVGVPTPDPEFFFVPDDPAFGDYRALFANTVCLLESRTPAPDKDPKSTPKLLNKMYSDNDHHVDQEKMLTARFLDMFIGDFDRHADQWKWGVSDTGKGKLYYPIPKDRDQAFFNSDGFLLSILSRQRMRSLQGFKMRIRDINGLNQVEKDFDKLFLNNLDKDAWERLATKFTNDLTDETIRDAVAKLPPSIAALDAKTIGDKLISRRNSFVKNALHYYTFLSKRVTVTGSNKNEYFHIKAAPNGLQLTVYKKTAKTDSATVMYRRVFNQRETHEIRLFGLNGDDKFDIDEDVRSTIRVRVIGGKGNDTFNFKGDVRNILYDLSSESNVLLHSRRTRNEMSRNLSVNDYKDNSNEYNKFFFPQVNLGFNAEDGFLAGIGFMARRYGFRKEPYASSHRLSTLYAPGRKAYQVKYQGTFNQLIFKNDLVIDLAWVDPVLNNFYGYGNETEFNKNLKKEYYRVRNEYLAADVLIRRRYKNILQFMIGPSYYHYWNEFEDNKDRILGNPANIGSDSISIYTPKTYIGIKARFNIDYVNNELYPTRGITWYTEFSHLDGTDKNSHTISKIQSDMSVYASISERSKVCAIFRLGGGHIFSRGFEYFQAMNLGSNNFLRGFRKDRFSGRSMAYESTELRVRLFKSRSYVFPGDVGLLGFFDVGRVWADNEHSKKWHNSFGGGLYYVPYSLVSLAASVGISTEASLLNISLGTKFNINF